MKNILDVIDKEFVEKYINEKLLGVLENNEYGYKSVVFCVIESVYSIGAVYKSTENVVNSFAKCVNLKDFRLEDYTPSQFLETYGEMEYINLASDIFNNHQKTSSRSGILKAEAVVRFIKIFNDLKIESSSDLLNYEYEKDLKDRIGKIPGQNSGISLDYVYMLAGDSKRFKKDRQIVNFFKDQLEYKNLNKSNLKDIFEEQFLIFKNTYEKISNIKIFDNLIWEFMTKKQHTKKTC